MADTKMFVCLPTKKRPVCIQPAGIKAIDGKTSSPKYSRVIMDDGRHYSIALPVLVIIKRANLAMVSQLKGKAE